MNPGTPCPDMPLLVTDWLTSNRITVMSPAQEGAFFRLLLCAWREADCTLPDDDEQLAELSRLRGEWPTLGPKVRACFVTDPEHPGKIFNDKQRRVRAEQDAPGFKSQRAACQCHQCTLDKGTNPTRGYDRRTTEQRSNTTVSPPNNGV